MANTNMGPVLDLVRQRVPVTDISVGPTSGWRERDDARVQEIVDLCYGGQMGMTIFGGVVLLKDQTDVALRYIIDDGLSTVLAWQQMSPSTYPITTPTPWESHGIPGLWR